MKAWRVLLAVLFVVVQVQISNAQAQECIREYVVTRLNTLQVSTCLLVRTDRKSGNGQAQQPIVMAIRQILKNVGKKSIELELPRDLSLRTGIGIYSQGHEISRKIPTPPPDSMEADAAARNDPGTDYQLLETGEKRVYDYFIQDFLAEEPKLGVMYSIPIRVDYDYRFLDEPKGQTYHLRRNEEKKLKQHVYRPFFKNVRLK